MRTADVIVVGAGIAGLTVADVLVQRRPTCSVIVLDAADHPGGQAVTSVVDGYIVEHGPTAVMVHEPETRALIDRHRLTGRVQLVDPAARSASIWTGGRQRRIPMSRGELVTSDLLSRSGLLRALAEPLVGRKGGTGSAPTADDSVHDFAERRFGPEFASVVAAAAVQGVTGGDARETSLEALWARVHAIDRAAGRGSFIGRAVRSASHRGKRPALHGPATFRNGGIGALPAAVAADLGDRIECGRSVHRVERGHDRRWSVTTDAAERVEADVLVLAIPARRAAGLVREVLPPVAALLGRIAYNDLRMVAFGFRSSDFASPPSGFGFLAPPAAGLGIIGAVISSNAFPGQAPPGRVLVRTFMGGSAHPDLVQNSRDCAVDLAMRELRRTMGVRGDPEMVWDIPWRQAIPHMALGHLSVVDRIDVELAGQQDLYVTGNSYRGVGLDDTIRHAADLGRQIADSFLARRSAIGGLGTLTRREQR